MCIRDSISRDHGQWYARAGVQMMAMFHPSALLRDPSKRPETFRDRKALQAKAQQLCPEVFAAGDSAPA